jgi:putative DNA methylase
MTEVPVLRKKLIEVALPLDAINKACAREKSIRHGHPSTLHLWWARRPLAAARSVIFAQMVDDPSSYVEVLRADPKLRRKAESALKARLKVWEAARDLAKKAEGTKLQVPEPGPAPTLDDILADQERQRLFRIIEDLVLWENTTNETVLQAARDEIWQSWRRTCVDNVDHPRAKELFDRDVLPAFHDPFAGGGALPLEAQRLGLESYASDLNPVAVLINKAMIEIPPKFAGKPPVNPEARKDETLIAREWKGAQGLAEDVRYYGKWMRDEAEKRIGHLYPKVEVTAEMAKERPDLEKYVGKQLTVIAWLWARTVKSPNPAFAQVDVPLASTFMLSTKAGKEAYVEPVIENGGYRFTVKVGKPTDGERAKSGTKVGRGGNFQCLMSGTPIPVTAIREQGLAGTFGTRLTAIVAEGDKCRVYLAPTPEHEAAARSAEPIWAPEQEINYNPRDIRTQLYGLTTYGDLFTPRQLAALTTFSDLVQEARERVQRDALAAGLPDDAKALRDGGSGAAGYADAVGVYLSLVVSKQTVFLVTLARWRAGEGKSAPAFGRQALPMVWDFADLNPFAGAGGDFLGIVSGAEKTLANSPPSVRGNVDQADAANQTLSTDRIISTDPPYYDNIGYADLSDFFYVWLRRLLRPVFPDLFATLAVPKAEELVATPYRHGSKDKAEAFFLRGMTQAMHCLTEQAHPGFPVTIYYAFKQAESDGGDGTTNTGWDTFLAAVIEAGFSISGTWPMRTENKTRLVGMLTNALASSILLVCRPRALDAPTATRRELVTALKAELPEALAQLQRGNIAPVDLAQAAIGPGMAVYTRYAKVLDAGGKPLTVREALTLINQTLDEALAEQEGDFDADSRWALTWFEQSGFDEGEYGVAEQLSKSKNTSVTGMVDAGILESKRGKVRLLRPDDLPADWDPTTVQRLTAWEIVHHLIRALASGGEGAAAALVAKLGVKGEVARELAYRLYTICDRPQKKRPSEALAYNGLVQSWPEIERLARETDEPTTKPQSEMFEGD